MQLLQAWSLPDFGTAVLYAILVSAAYTFAVALSAGAGRPRLLTSARLGAYGTSALVLLGVLVLAYAFVTHDFRIRYVSRYSDRSMDLGYLVAALWGGQDGSLLWWLLLLSLYTTACIAWLRNKYRELQPYVIATLMVIVAFFGILMLFAANPFETNLAGAQVDGEGLNPLLQNFYMIIHPPSLYLGFVGCSIPFAFAVAALVTGRLDNEWIIAARKWMLFAWLFLSVGNALGMLWAYEELGWGGYWAWDPVENAACLPWFTASAYVHSTMIQERRSMLKVWNVSLICVTFFLTIFGTFLTRSGLIASVHSFAQSDIGIYFVGFMAVVVAAAAGLVVWRLPQLRARTQIESVLSREAVFVLNNWLLLGGMTFIAVATLFPKISEWLWGEVVTVGPPFFNRWMAPIGIVIFLFMGLGPLLGWRKTSERALRKALTIPLAVLAGTALLHLAAGTSLGFPPLVQSDAFYPGTVGVVLQKIGSAAPLIVVSLVGFNFAVIVQEFARGVAARRRSSEESVLTALGRLVDKNRRRYGGYVVHTGVALMFLGFAGKAWSIDKEAVLSPGDTYTIGDYELTYRGTRMEVDRAKRMVFADLDVTRSGQPAGRVSPAKFIYFSNPEQGPTTEVSMLHSLRDDLYVVVGNANPTTKRATFQFHVNPLVSWIWFGVGFLILGASISLWPEVTLKEMAVWTYAKAAAGAATGVMITVLVAATAGAAHQPGPPVAATAGLTRAELPAHAVSRPGTEGMWAAPAGGAALGLSWALFVGRRRRERE